MLRAFALATLLASAFACVTGGDGAAPSPSPPAPDPSARDAGSQQALVVPPCRVSGCSSQLCAEQDLASTCEWRPEYACYRDARCEPQPGDACGWTQTPELLACLEAARAELPPCHVGGCSSQVCSEDEGVVTTCEWRAEYACYRTARCERQADAQCGWTQTSELLACLEEARSEAP